MAEVIPLFNRDGLLSDLATGTLYSVSLDGGADHSVPIQQARSGL